MPTNVKRKITETVIFAICVIVIYKTGTGCIFKYFFDIPCPACGLTRATLSLLTLDFKSAVNYNYMVFSLPYLYLFYFFDGRVFKKRYIDYILLSLIGIGFIARYIFILRS